MNSDVQIFQIYGHTTRIPDFRVIGPSENRLKSDMSDSPDFYISEIRGDRFTDFCVHTVRLLGNRLQNVGRLEKIGQWDHGIILPCVKATRNIICQTSLMHCFYDFAKPTIKVWCHAGRIKKSLFKFKKLILTL